MTFDPQVWEGRTLKASQSKMLGVPLVTSQRVSSHKRLIKYMVLVNWAEHLNLKMEFVCLKVSLNKKVEKKG